MKVLLHEGLIDHYPFPITISKDKREEIVKKEHIFRQANLSHWPHKTKNDLVACQLVALDEPFVEDS